ncbi:uncharacterized protein K452DRAFT_228198 [Aplosporella prunicola CBS 121167]|uniref:Uncharacterized protein n=1 Tax=Aplosporella prunicola CBS 121167 TaxID=1176127 RepID=A0A6A6BE34_9PEZI|nr:uncharacterized protein K452DRAFT_228198 [Aplosporella prunicola CBS 121167]KAF2141778.1 hypothetical protein K452DRAFT_228198 [Aplosporella prunicola CBS 121167]
MSPPTSPPKNRKRKHDPFLELAKTPISTPLPSPDSERAIAEEGTTSLARTVIFLTPLIVTSFILSLFIVNRRQRAWRLAEHPPLQGTRAWLSQWSPWKWLDPEPYQDPNDSTWQNANASSTATGDGGIPGVDGQAMAQKYKPGQGQGWHRRKKHRKMAKLEFSEAFDMQWQVLMTLAVAWALVVVIFFWGAKKVISSAW